MNLLIDIKLLQKNIQNKSNLSENLKMIVYINIFKILYFMGKKSLLDF